MIAVQDQIDAVLTSPIASTRLLVECLCGDVPPLCYDTGRGFYAKATIPGADYPNWQEFSGGLEETAEWAYKKKRRYPDADVTLETPGGTLVPITLDPV